VGHEVELSGDVDRPGATGSVYSGKDTYSSSERPIPQLPIGQWNTIGIIVVGKTLEVRVNDRVVKTHQLPEVNAGFIGLQHRGDGLTVRFRNIRIMAD
jgi:hypothetical protein